MPALPSKSGWPWVSAKLFPTIWLSIGKLPVGLVIFVPVTTSPTCTPEDAAFDRKNCVLFAEPCVTAFVITLASKLKL